VYADTFSNLGLQGFDSMVIVHDIPCTAPNVANYPLTAWLEAPGDGDHSNDTGTTMIFGAAFMPAKIPVMEERGGTWCGWCVRGLFFNDSLARLHPEASIIAVHNGHGLDPMAIPLYDTFMGSMHINGVYVSQYGFPTVITDRRQVDDPVNSIYEYEKYKQYFGYGTLDLGPSLVNNNHLSIDVHFKPAINLNGEYRLEMVLVEDSVHKDSLLYDQTNSYSYMMQNIPFYGYEALPSPIPAAEMYYDFVARAVLPAPLGAAGSLPMQMSYNNTYTYTFQTDLDTAWKKEKMKVVAMLIRSSDTFILNSVNRQLLTPVNVKAETKVIQMEAFPNPASESIYVHTSFEKPSAYRLLLCDMSGKTIIDRQYEASKQATVALPVGNLAPGVYSLQLKTDGETVNKMVTVAR
jgi:hypothetical protein